MSTVSEQLRSARVAKNLTVEQVAEITKMRTDHIRALEEGQFKAFPAPVYIRGSVRTYAGLLKLDVPSVMKSLDEELAGDESFDESLSHRSESWGLVDLITLQLSKLNWKSGLIVGITVLVAGIAFFGFLAARSSSSKDPLRDLEPGVYKGSNTVGNTLPLPRS